MLDVAIVALEGSYLSSLNKYNMEALVHRLKMGYAHGVTPFNGQIQGAQRLGSACAHARNLKLPVT